MGRVASVLCSLMIVTLVTPAAAELYRWTDADGVLHYTSDLDSIPQAHRPGVHEIGSPRPRQAPTVETSRDGDAGRMWFSGGAPIVAAVVINGVWLRLIVDTGAGRTLISSAAVARSGLSADGGRPVRILGVTGSALGRELEVAQMEVAGARVGPVRVVVHDTPGEGADGLLGRDVLDYFTLTVDTTAGRAMLTPR